MGETSASSKVFGTSKRTEILVAIAARRTATLDELEQAVRIPRRLLVFILRELLGERILKPIRFGGQNRVCLNPRYHAASELKALILKLGAGASATRPRTRVKPDRLQPS